jgi:hypothetical protein
MAIHISALDVQGDLHYGNATAVSSCDTGDVLLGGGWGLFGSNVTFASGLPSSEQNETFVGQVNGTGIVGSLASPICFDNPPLR